ncbi:hypothetical protein R3P38DRAFT_3325015 [Favolaschia claudopus]|uniref:Uncharacterized protein n=1 Tax=Favolaschia claudopus TaxID=2862362 RepID=A0AAW0AFB0_9AGAR
MPDPVYDASNPHPVINRKNSTRSGDASQPPSNTTKRNTTAVPSTSKTSSGAPKPAASGRKPPSLATASPRPSPATTSQTLGSRVASPTTASAARDVHAPAPRLAPFGTAAPRLPSHMFDQQTRGPPAARTDAKSVLRAPLGRTKGRLAVPPPSTRLPPLRYLSISSALPGARGLRSPEETPRFFKGPGRIIDLFEEPLVAAVERYHGAYDPNTSSFEDPLMYYGAVGGELPGCDSSQALALRDAHIRYFHESRTLSWSSIPSLIERVLQCNPADVPLLVTRQADSPKTFYCLNLSELARVGHAVVASQQILEALSAFLRQNPSTSFTIDPDFQFLLQLEYSDSASEARFLLMTLQMRLEGADRHIRSYFQRIQATLTGREPSDYVSSADSTLSEHPSKELRRLLLRDSIDEGARDEFLSQLGEQPRATYYKRRPAEGVPTIKEDSERSYRPYPPATSAPMSAAPVGPSVRFAPAVRSPPPRTSAITFLPGHGRLRGPDAGAPAFGNGGPSFLRVEFPYLPVEMEMGMTAKAEVATEVMEVTGQLDMEGTGSAVALEEEMVANLL